MQHIKSACFAKLRAFAALFLAFILAFALLPLCVSKAEAATNATLKYNGSLLYKGKQQSGACLCYCYSYATTIAMGALYSPSKFKCGTGWSAKSMKGSDQGEFTYSGSRFATSKTSAAELQHVYDQVVAGHPVILYVNTKTGGQHWVVIVGVTNADRNNLSLANFLMLDSACVEANQPPKVMTVASKSYTLRYGNDNVRVSNSTVGILGKVGTSGTSTEESQLNAQSCTISSYTTPKSLSYGAGFMPKGTIKSTAKITKVKAYIYNAAGKVLQTATVKPGKTKVKLQTKYSGKKIAGSLKFSKLKPGTYSYAVRAYTAAGSTWVLAKTAFSVYTPKASISKLSKLTATSAQIKWAKVKGASGYQLRYSVSKNFASAKKLTTSAKKKSLSKLKQGTVYYVQVRSFAKANGKRCYGEWSEVKSFTTASTKATKTSAKSAASPKSVV
ncbi:MAG: hypothetical protein Q4A43_01030 [Coriobacteriia bacterium]|nr:hypothetical protein [Coriobacteriia bacterium]